MNGKNLAPVLISGVSCYEQDGIAYLRLEDVARGLGFTQTQNKGGIEYTSIRWETVKRYLEDFGFPNKLGKDDYIPENIFYRLAMKAKNETAEKFQALVADEIIPSIRKPAATPLCSQTRTCHRSWLWQIRRWQRSTRFTGCNFLKANGWISWKQPKRLTILSSLPLKKLRANGS